MSPRPDDAEPDPHPEGDEPDLAPGGRLRLRVVGVILFAEAVALAAFAGYLLANLIGGSDQTTETQNTVIETVAFFVIAGLLALLGRGALGCRRWSRAPVFVTQLIALLGPGLSVLQGDLWYRFVVGVPLAAGATVALLLVLTPSAGAAYDEAESD